MSALSISEQGEISSDFEVIFGGRPEELEHHSRSLAEASVVSAGQYSQTDEFCICENFIISLAARARSDRSSDMPFWTPSSTTLTLADFLAHTSACQLCNWIRQLLRTKHRNAEQVELFEQSQSSYVYLDFVLASWQRIPTVSLRACEPMSLETVLLADFYLSPLSGSNGESTHFPQLITFEEPELRSPSSVTVVAHWLQACSLHRSCRCETAALPSRVLDVGTATQTVRLYITSDEDVQTGQYIALSYCWGGYDGIKLTSSRLEAFSKGLESELFPKTYTDAILLTRKLGIRWLWIDALCIMQDDVNDWEKESARMDQVYGNATLTISASVASTTAEGFLYERDPMTNTRAYCGSVTHEGDVVPVYLMHEYFSRTWHDINPEKGLLSKEPLSRRAWTLQERLLSKRIVHFTTNGMIWQCQEKSCSEDGTPTRPDQDLSTIAISDKDELWFTIAEAYSFCLLSKSSDRLPALAGLARVFSGLQDDTYSAGHWRSSILQSLMWYAWHSGREKKHNAPSWSWTSMRQGVAFGSMARHKEIHSPVAEVLGIITEPCSSCTVSPDLDKLVISAPIATLALLTWHDTGFEGPAQVHSAVVFLGFVGRIPIGIEAYIRLDDGDVAVKTQHSANEFWTTNASLRCAIAIFHSREGISGEPDGYQCLLLQPLSPKGLTFKRIGMCHLDRLRRTAMSCFSRKEMCLV